MQLCYLSATQKIKPEKWGRDLPLIFLYMLPFGGKKKNNPAPPQLPSPPEPPGLELALSGAEDSALEHTTEKSVVYQGFSLLMHLNNISFTERLLSGQMTQVTENSYFYLLQHKRL